MKEIELTKGKVALVDDADFERLNQWKWHASQSHAGVWYARRCEGKKHVLMHRAILDAAPDTEVDHADSNGLNNCRANLRPAERNDNMRNRGPSVRNTSGIKGVHWHKRFKVWQARITTDKGRLTLGSFADKNEAARAYAVAASKHHGDFARTA